MYIDGRNAAAVVDRRGPTIDHRMGSTGTRITRPAVVATTPSAPYQYPAMGYMPAATSWSGYPVYPPYVMPPQLTPTSNLASILGGFGDIGTLANILAQAFAAFLPLPAAPTPQDVNDSESASVAGAVNSSNLIRYQNALALFARRDQQILTLGSILKELFKRPGITVG
ncbi:MAG TPA: hypothetical protein VFT22_15280 [Kofleriaceae bacterium]|nr:hypothetical protein [Kofleriaceae bacterium]